MKKRAISLLLILSVLLGCFPSGAVVLAVGSFGDTTPILEDTGLYNALGGDIMEAEAFITYDSDISDFVIEEGVLTEYTGEGGNIAIPDGVVEIAAEVFRNNISIIRMVLNPELEIVGEYAFSGCTNLLKLTMNDGLLTIGSYAFDGANKLAGGLEIPETVTSIGTCSFRNCGVLTGSLVIPESVTDIGASAFQNCTGLNGTLTLSYGLVTIGNSAFQNCRTLTGDLIIPDSVTSVGNSAFNSCMSFNGRLELSSKLTAISDSAFYECRSITGEIVIPDSVTTINGWSAFANIYNITGVIFGEKFTSFGRQIFVNDGLLETLTFKGLTVPSLSDGGIFTQIPNLKTVYVPAPVYSSYVSAYAQYVGPNVEFSSDTLTLPVSNLSAEKVYSKSVYITWTPHINPGVARYIIERDGDIIGETANCGFYDSGLTTGQSYSYRVYGVTSGGLESGKKSVNATPTAPVVTSIRTENALNKVVKTRNTLFIDIKNTKNHLPIDDKQTTGTLYYVSPDNGERILIGDALVRTVAFSTVTYAVGWDVEDIAEGTYDVVFVLTDVDGATDELTAQIIVDQSVPAKIENVIAIGDIDGITLSWSISAEVDTTRYRIYRRSEIDTKFYELTTVSGRNILTYRDLTVARDRLYQYYVAGVNDLGIEGVASEFAAAIKGVDDEAPQVTKLSPANMSYINGRTAITATATDNVAVTKSEFYYSTGDGETWTLFHTKSGSPFTAVLDTTAFADGVIRVKAVAYDALGNESAPLTYAYSIDNTGPEKVLWTETPYSSTSVTVTLSWLEVSDEDITFFRVQQRNPNGSYTNVVDIHSTLGANITNLAPDTEYTYRVIGYDHLGNEGIPSDDVITRTARDAYAPVISAITPRPTDGETSFYSTEVRVMRTPFSR